MPPRPNTSPQQQQAHDEAAASSSSSARRLRKVPSKSSNSNSSGGTGSRSRSYNRLKMPVSLNKNTLVRTEKCSFLIMDAPTNNNLKQYIEQMKEHNVTALARACKPSYDKAPVEKAGIRVEDMCFADGTSPPEDILRRWLELTEEQFQVTKAKSKKANDDESPPQKKEGEARACVAVHCVAGLGRAPVLVALALMEIERMDAFAAIEEIRSKRRGAFNATQLDYLEQYKRRRRRGSKPQCVIM